MDKQRMIDNMYYGNIPAGSGKTYNIVTKIRELLNKDSDFKILCVTYTKRAAEEMNNQIGFNSVEISTIHSYISSFLKPFLKLPAMKDLYFEYYKNEILEDIKKNLNKNIDENNILSKIIPNFEEGDEERYSDNEMLILIKNKINELYYTETQYNSFLFGGLSHDALIEFVEEASNKYKSIRDKVGRTYDYIFIDEVQDTSTSILRLFYNTTIGTKTTVYYYGDTSQQIYNNYDGSFQDKFSSMTKISMSDYPFNYRSSEEILTVLNQLYNGDTEFQKSFNGPKGINPKIIVVEDVHQEAYSKDYDNHLKLFVNTKHKYKNMENLFKSIDEIYPYSSSITASDALDPTSDNFDMVLSIIITIFQLYELYDGKKFGEVIQLIKKERVRNLEGKRYYLFNQSNLRVSKHTDKVLLKKIIETESVDSLSDLSISCAINKLIESNLVNSQLLSILESITNSKKTEYESLLEVEMKEVYDLYQFSKNPLISTQHGVKGESHDAVCFVTESTKYSPYTRTYEALELFSKEEDFKLSGFENFYYEFRNEILNFESEEKLKIKDLSTQHEKKVFTDFIDVLNEKFKENIYYNYLFFDLYKEINIKREKSSIKSIKKILSFDDVRRVLISYKLFYVGCSRAKNDLVVLVQEDKISDFKSEFITRMTEIGFEVKEAESDVTQ